MWKSRKVPVGNVEGVTGKRKICTHLYKPFAKPAVAKNLNKPCVADKVLFYPWIRDPDLGWEKIRIRDTRLGINISNHISESLKKIFGTERSWSGINIPDPQHRTKRSFNDSHIRILALFQIRIHVYWVSVTQIRNQSNNFKTIQLNRRFWHRTHHPEMGGCSNKFWIRIAETISHLIGYRKEEAMPHSFLYLYLPGQHGSNITLSLSMLIRFSACGKLGNGNDYHLMRNS